MEARAMEGVSRADESGKPGVVCAWCAREQGRARTEGVGVGGGVSHGICRYHAGVLLGEVGLRLHDLGDGVDRVALVGGAA